MTDFMAPGLSPGKTRAAEGATACCRFSEPPSPLCAATVPRAFRCLHHAHAPHLLRLAALLALKDCWTTRSRILLHHLLLVDGKRWGGHPVHPLPAVRPLHPAPYCLYSSPTPPFPTCVRQGRDEADGAVSHPLLCRCCLFSRLASLVPPCAVRTFISNVCSGCAIFWRTRGIAVCLPIPVLRFAAFDRMRCPVRMPSALATFHYLARGSWCPVPAVPHSSTGTLFYGADTGSPVCGFLPCGRACSCSGQLFLCC